MYSNKKHLQKADHVIDLLSALCVDSYPILRQFLQSEPNPAFAYSGLR